MSRPDKPAPGKPGHTDRNGSGGDKELHESIDELEHLISDNGNGDSGGYQQSDIPVLDDVVRPEDYPPGADNENTSAPGLSSESDEPGSISDEQIAELLENVEQRISGELNELVNILTDTIKDSIITELRSELKSEFHRTPDSDEEPDR